MAEKLYPFTLYIRHKPHLFMIIGAIFLNVALWVELIWNIRPQKDLLFLHYNILFGVDLFGEWWRIFYLPLGGLFIIMVNTAVGWLLFQKGQLGSVLLHACSILCQMLLLVEAVLLVFLNG